MRRLMPVPDHTETRAAYGAWMLLVILSAHLVVMATPLHELLMHPEQPVGPAPMHVAQDSPSMLGGPRVAEADAPAHCAILWTLPSQTPLRLTTSAVGVPTAICVLPSLRQGLASVPRTLSPPLGADWQARLQVFRI